MYALVNGDNFYVSCKRVFRPSRQGHPVVVVSNNDARSILQIHPQDIQLFCIRIPGLCGLCC